MKIALVEERTGAGVIVRAVRVSDRVVLGERCVLSGRGCFRRRLAAARRELRLQFPA
jgi:hypothetical protein